MPRSHVQLRAVARNPARLRKTRSRKRFQPCRDRLGGIWRDLVNHSNNTALRHPRISFRRGVARLYLFTGTNQPATRPGIAMDRPAAPRLLPTIRSVGLRRSLRDYVGVLELLGAREMDLRVPHISGLENVCHAVAGLSRLPGIRAGMFRDDGIRGSCIELGFAETGTAGAILRRLFAALSGACTR